MKRRTADHTLIKGSNLLEGTKGKVDRVGVRASRAVIGNGNSHRLVVLRVGDLNLFTTEAGLIARVAVASLV